jgi:drug/metabolite transporter (DMT)-like permease
MLAARIGEFAAMGTALCWTVTALAFEAAGRRIGSLTVNLARLVMASALFALYGWIVHGAIIPVEAGMVRWAWLVLSGLAGFVLGDLLLLQAFVEVGARISMLVYSSVPPLTAILARVALDERLSPLAITGMLVTVSGIVLVVLKNPRPAGDRSASGDPAAPALAATPTLPVAMPNTRKRARGVLLAFGGSVGQAAGVILARIGAGVEMDPFGATQIRTLAGMFGFAVVFSVARRWRLLGRALRNRPAMNGVALGAVFGPFLGVTLGLYAVQHTSVGIASTIIALVPVLIIVPSVIIFRERVTVREVVGAVIAVCGVALLML